MIRIWKRHPVLVSAFALAVALTLWFAVTSITHAVYWANHRDLKVQPWMTLGYVSRSWQVDPHELEARVGLERPEGKPRTLVFHAADKGMPVAELIAQIEGAIAAVRAEEAAAKAIHESLGQ